MNNRNKFNRHDQNVDNNYQNDVPDCDLKLYVLNENNKYVTRRDIEDILLKFGIKHKVKSLENFQEALTHSSYMDRDLTTDRLAKLVRDKEKDLEPIPHSLVSKAIPLQQKCYERLEFKGDSVIHDILATYLFLRFPDEQEGFLTRLRTKIENGETLAKLSKTVGLDNYVLIGRNIEQMGGRENNIHIFEDIFEAFVGALSLEVTYEVCYKFVIDLVEREIDIANLIFVETNYKNTLLQYYHKMKWPDPDYGTVKTIENNNKKNFVMYVKGYKKNRNELEWSVVGEGSGSSKRAGEQEAARMALESFGIISAKEDDEYEEIYDEKQLKYD
jgi:dsRNA-specific ribonuclease